MLKLMTLIVVILLYGTAVAQELIIYPAKNQSNEQTEKDKFACYSWAKGQTGFDPMATPQATTSRACATNKERSSRRGYRWCGRCGPGRWHWSDCRWFERRGKRSWRSARCRVAPSAESEATRKTNRRSRRKTSENRSSWLNTSRGEIIIIVLTVLVWRVEDTQSGRIGCEQG